MFRTSCLGSFGIDGGGTGAICHKSGLEGWEAAEQEDLKETNEISGTVGRIG